MRNTGNKFVLAALLFSMVLVGCKTKVSTVETMPLDKESMDMVMSSPSVVVPRTCLSGNVKLSVNVDGSPFSAKGTMRIKEGNGVQIGVTALGLIELACLEFLPENMRLIYKIGKEYTEVPYSDVTFLEKTGINYSMLESVLLNKLFSPDGRPFLQAMKDMSFGNEGNCITVTTKEINGIIYKFYIDKIKGELVQSEGTHVDGGKVICHYSDFCTVNGATFPHTILLTLEGVGSAASLQFVLDRVDTRNFMFTPRSVSSYKKSKPEQMLKLLEKI
ncbi:MAG: DUF4292 domain-containing protein [Bacteroidaceae bacterium]|nr:DUF4292 domain-containing protein [Bacteroidaceae bacterium]